VLLGLKALCVDQAFSWATGEAVAAGQGGSGGWLPLQPMSDDPRTRDQSRSATAEERQGAEGAGRPRNEVRVALHRASGLLAMDRKVPPALCPERQKSWAGWLTEGAWVYE
jgi:hypothetical protein